MSNKEKIKDWVKNLKSQASTIPNLGINALAGFQLACDDVIAFIKSLPEEPASEDLEQTANKYGKEETILPEGYNDGDIPDYEKWTADAFKAGAEWQRQKDQETIELAEDHAMFAGMMKEREEMMKGAAEGEYWDGSIYLDERPTRYKDGDRVKVILIKEDK